LRNLIEIGMNIRKKSVAALFFILIMVTGIFWFVPDQAVEEGMLIVTAIPSGIDLEKDDLGYDGRYIPEARILAVDPRNTDFEPMVLTEEFYSARSPEVSYDGKAMVFSAQKTENDIWQIYVKDLQTLLVKQVTQCPVNCTDPVWLPDGRIGFSRLNDGEVAGKSHVLYACFPDGSAMERLTFHPNSDISSTVTMDGRIITTSLRKYPQTGLRQMLALRIDGTKSELFFENDNGSYPSSRSWEAPDGRVYFVEKDAANPVPGKLVSVDHGHPLSSWKDHSVNEPGSSHSVFPLDKNLLCLSYRAENNPAFGLYFFDVEGRKMTREILTDPEYHLIEPVAVQVRELPMKLPPVVESIEGKGTLLCHDTDLSMVVPDGNPAGAKKTHKVQIFGIDGLLGEVDVEKDGSFYVEIDADMPVSFRTLDEEGKILRGPSAWVWVRPNERRSCIGCHEDRELAPENRVPEALYGGMISLPEGKKSGSVVLTEKYVGK
jgi:hypothetical protein